MFKNVFKRKNSFAKERIFPQLFNSLLIVDFHDESDTPLKIRDGNRLVEHKFVDGVVVNILLENDDGFSKFVCRRDMEEWNSDEEFLLAQSLKNLDETVLVRTTLNKRKSDDGNFDIFFVDGGGDFSASLVLSEQFWFDYSIDVTKIAVAIPHRHTMVFTSDKSENSLRYLHNLLPTFFDDPEEIPNRLILNGVLTCDVSSNKIWNVIKPNLILN
jgi:uncharacterized protein YtpQ (UPF0354 family)